MARKASKLPEHVEALIKYVQAKKENANNDLARTYFRKVWGDNFKTESDAANADGYVAGHFVLELKGSENDWLAGLFQGIAYQRELDFSLVVVITNGFIGIWDIEDLAEEVREEILKSKGAPSAIGKKFATAYKKKKSQFEKKAIYRSPAEFSKPLFSDSKIILKQIKKFEDTLNTGRKVKSKVTLKNFKTVLKEMLEFFPKDQKTKAVRAFYRMIFDWRPNSILKLSKRNDTQATLAGELIEHILPEKMIKFKSFVESHYVSLSDGEDIDDFFARYDEALDAVDKNFRTTHGIFFTDLSLSKFVMWFVRKHLGDIGKNYLVIDPACGSGNLVTNWRSPLELRHKVVSEIEPELLYTVEQRMKKDRWHEGKYTIVPKVTEGKGLNFLDRSAEDYLNEVRKYLVERGHEPDKPIAFLCNPPYRSDDDQASEAATYNIHPSIEEIIGKDATAERYCCFLAQMQLICEKAKESGLPGESLLLLFTKSAWLTKRPVFEKVRKSILSEFEDIGGLIVNGKEFFDVKGKFPVAFTVWRYKGAAAKLDSERSIPLVDLSWISKKELKEIEWDNPNAVETSCSNILKKDESIVVPFGTSRQSIREWSGLTRFDFQREKRKAEKTDKHFRCGLPDGDRRHARKKTLGEKDGQYIGFMDDVTPCRIKKETGHIPWFRLNPQFMDIRKNRCYSGPADKYAYSASDLESAKTTFTWFALTRTFVDFPYPMWADAEELWPINVPKNMADICTQIAFAIGLAENECVDTIFPAHNPVEGAPEIRVRNPMCPTDSESFWSRTMASAFDKVECKSADELVKRVEEFYKLWTNTLKSKSELTVDYEKPYFVEKGILRPTSGIIQIKDFANETKNLELQGAYQNIQEKLKIVKNEFYDLLLDEQGLNYFGNPESEPASSTRKVKPAPTKTPFDQTLEKRLILASKIVDSLADSKSFGRTKLEKAFYLADQLSDEELRTEYYREAAGPLDQRCLYHKKNGLEVMGSKKDCFKTKAPKGGKISYIRGEKLTSWAGRFPETFKHSSKIESMLKKVSPMDTEQIEIVATLYACWNDFLIKKKPIDNDILVEEFRNNWHEKKKRFSEARLKKAIDWMKKNDLIPGGKGKLTKVRPPEPDELF